ncbi:MAG: hypothetical protein IJV64_11145 [Oscillospiraceae bacterium]|nr:hypothetical protein [Oscillospiraceae bacterium]
MSNWKKTVSSIALAALLLLFLASCGAKESGNGSAPSEFPATEESSPAPNDPPAAAEEPDAAEADDLSGSWQDEISQRASMDVTRSGDGSYTLFVHWGSSATEASIWEIVGTFDESGTLTYEDGKYGVCTFDESGSETVSDEETTRGSFTLEDGKLRWQYSRVEENDHSEGGLFVKFE